MNSSTIATVLPSDCFLTAIDRPGFPFMCEIFRTSSAPSSIRATSRSRIGASPSQDTTIAPGMLSTSGRMWRSTYSVVSVGSSSDVIGA